LSDSLAKQLVGSSNTRSYSRPILDRIRYMTGDGESDPELPDGSLVVDTLPKPRLPISILIDGLPAEVLYAGGAPGLPSAVTQLNVTVPAGVRKARTCRWRRRPAAPNRSRTSRS